MTIAISMKKTWLAWIAAAALLMSPRGAHAARLAANDPTAPEFRRTRKTPGTKSRSGATASRKCATANRKESIA